jgi:hypothetical protein
LEGDFVHTDLLSCGFSYIGEPPSIKPAPFWYSSTILDAPKHIDIHFDWCLASQNHHIYAKQIDAAHCNWCCSSETMHNILAK